MSVVRAAIVAPATWGRVRIKYLTRSLGGGTPSKGNSEYWAGNIPWVSPKDMKSFEIFDTEDRVTEAGVLASAARLVEPGAVLLVMRSGILRHTLPVAINRVPVTLNQDIRAFIPGGQLHPEYFARLIEGHQREFLELWSKEGTTVESLESELIGDTEIALPPLPQQRAIADFLSREADCLDALIAAKERMLRLLEEKRRALITRAVTRGIDPDVQMRDSGVPWLGEVPAHWTAERLKFSLHFIEQGWSPQCDNTPAEVGEWGVLKAGCVNGWKFVPTENKRLPDNVEPLSQFEVREGDVLMSRANTTALLGSAALVNGVRSQLLMCDMLYRLRIDETRLSKAFFVALSQTPVCRYQFEREATGTSNSMQNIGQDTVRNLLIPLPPRDEQERILRWVESETAKLDAVRTATERTVALIRERRASLIAAAVTGQLAIPELVEQSPEEEMACSSTT